MAGHRKTQPLRSFGHLTRFRERMWLGHRMCSVHPRVSGIGHGSGFRIGYGPGIHRHPSMCFRHRMGKESDGSWTSYMAQVSTQFKHQTRFRHWRFPRHGNGPSLQIILASQMVQAQAVDPHCIWPRHPCGSGIRLASSIRCVSLVDMDQASMSLRHQTRMWPALRIRRRHSYNSGIG